MAKINYDVNDYIFKSFNNDEDWFELQRTDFNHVPEISFVEGVTSTDTFDTDPKEVFDLIRDGTFAKIITQIRKSDDKEERSKLKKQLPAILFGGTFVNDRKTLNVASNLTCVDFDHVNNLQRWVKRLRWNRNVYGFFISPSGDGLKVLVRTTAENAADYKKVITQLFAHFKEIGLSADSSKQNINDLCFFSHDPNAYLNTQATIWRLIEYPIPKDSEWSDSQIKDSVYYILTQIEEKKIDITSRYEDWLNICFGFVDQFGEDGREYFHRISQFYEKAQEEEIDRQFDYCLKSAGKGVTIRSLFRIALDNGLKLSQSENSHEQQIVDPFDKEFYTGEELLLRNINHLPTLLDPILPKVGLVALGGSSDVGKSTFLRNLAINVSSGESHYIKFPINAAHKRAIYVSTEDDDNAVSFLINKQNQTLKKPSSSFRRLIYVFDTLKLLKTLEKMLKSTPVDLIVIDTFADLYGGEMNKVNQVRKYLHDFALLAGKYECLIIMLHHTGKRTDHLPPSKDNLLGSQGFEAKMRLVLELRKDHEDPKIRHLCIVKGNYLASEYKGSSFVLEFDSDMIFRNTGERVPFSELAAKKVDREAEKQKWIEIAKPLIESGKTYQEVSENLKEKGFNVSKSTIQREIPKN